MFSFSSIKRVYASLKNSIPLLKKNWMPKAMNLISKVRSKFTRKNILSAIKRSPIYLLILFLFIVYLVYKILEKAVVLAKIGEQRLEYGILSPCFHCTYGKSRERIIIVSGGGYGNRKGKVLMILDHKNMKIYSNRGDCLGIEICHKCLDTLELKDVTCNFKELR